MKEIRIFLFALAFSLIVLGIHLELFWLYYCSAGVFLVEALWEYRLEQQKKKQAVFLIYDKGKTMLNYGLIVSFLTLQYLLSAQQSQTALLFYVTFLVWIGVARAGDQYYAFDEQGVKTLRRAYAYQQMETMTLTTTILALNMGPNQALTIKRSLLDERVLEYLNQKIKSKNEA